MAGSSKTRVIDHGHDALIRNVAKMKKAAVEVGIFSAEGAQEYEGGKATVLDVATFNEFGLGVPERSFLRDYVDQNEPKIRGYIRALALKIKEGKIDQQIGLERLGLKIVGEIQKRIADGIPPPNAASTIERKGSSKPLIDTEQLRSSITPKVVGS